MDLRLDAEFECFSLEDVAHDGHIFVVKVPGATAIPVGRYGARLSFSQQFRTNFTGIRIHRSNTPTDTEGGVLVSRSRVDRMLESRLVFMPLLGKIRLGLAAGTVTLAVVNVR